MCNIKLRVGNIIQDSSSETSPLNPEEILISWKDSFTFKKENDSSFGLRSPQIGAIHAALAHWEVTNESATIVMPTGTGKTETMLSLLVVAQCRKLLVVVPTDALRTQISNKFISLGLLKTLKLIKEEVFTPFVGILNHKPKSIEEIQEFFNNCNVVVTTMSIVGSLEPAFQSEISTQCSHLFIDEAHHIGAETWRTFKNNFKSNYILQFTATPFRNDDKPINDKIIFNYPLRKAQEEGYFKPIDFIPIYEWDIEQYDFAIAEKGVSILREDLSNGFDHILMARVANIKRAEQVFEIYKRYVEFNPVVVHSQSKKIEEIRKQILNHESRIIVCVDMLGEGFDLPELKIAVFHDIKKSLPITLQLTGRFTRSSRDSNLGNASIVVNLATTEASKELEQLYASDSDWNYLLPLFSEDKTQDQINFYDFIKGFVKFPSELQLQNIKPAMSTVVYQTNTESWFPSKFDNGIIGIEDCEQIYSDINSERRTLIVVTGYREPIKWGKIDDLFQLIWTLYIVYWNQDKQLLYIHSSENAGNYEKLANAVTNDTAELINAEKIYRSLHGIVQMKINNVGLKNQLDKLLSFTLHTGEDIAAALTQVLLANKVKSNIFCTGYEFGEKISIGCSYKGRIWARLTTNIEGFIKWCDHNGNKLLDDTIDINSVMKGAIIPKVISTLPTETDPISISWNDSLYSLNEDAIYLIRTNKTKYPLYTFDLKLVHFETDYIRFQVSNDTFSSIYEMQLFTQNEIGRFRFVCIENPLEILIGNKQLPLINYFKNESPIIRFTNGSSLEANIFYKYKYLGPPYSNESIIDWNWSGINIRKESQGEEKDIDSIQYRAIEILKQYDYDIIFDDDNSGEIADVITIKLDDATRMINIELYHLKFSHGDDPGRRINDLYEVCGQAQKSVIWKAKGTFDLLKRMIKRTQGTKKQRIETGDIKLLTLIKEKSKKYYSSQYKVFVVQPGLSISKVSDPQLEILAVTENHLMETYRINFGVIGSE